MARKRGGLAGIWDRNKQIIKPLATGVAGALTGGAGAAVLGGLMSGLDREGKKGIGFDIGQGVKGAVQGYGTGAAGAGVKGLLTGGLKGNMTAMEGMRGAMKDYNRLPFGMGGQSAAPGAEALERGTASMNKGLSMLDGAGGAGGVGGGTMSPPPTNNNNNNNFSMSGLLRGVRENKDIIGGAVKGAQMMMPSASDDAALMNAETGRMRYNLEEKEIEERRKRNQNLMALLMPYLENTGYLNQPG